VGRAGAGGRPSCGRLPCSVLPDALLPHVDWLPTAAPEEIEDLAARLAPGSAHLATMVGNLMLAGALRMAEVRSGRNLSDAQQAAQ
jgi:hypothetical protein